MDTLLQETDMTEQGDNILSVAPGGLFLFAHYNILRSVAMPFEEIVNFF